MVAERRREQNQLPAHLDEVLNEMQLFSLKRMERYGWMLAFIRRPLFQDIVTVLRHQDCHKFSILNEDGTLNAQPDIALRQFRPGETDIKSTTSATYRVDQ
ncbi:MAG: hypothetical protein KJO10_01835 [Gammaproteobacteria bacterium]|nr:hypothetical protein [Gammaproteobacteria bacterium]